MPPSDANALDLSVSLTGVRDLSAFTNGLSILTKHRLYLKEDFNQVKGASRYDNGDGVDDDSDYPPTSLFSPEMRYSINSSAVNVHFTGRVAVGGRVLWGPLPQPPLTPSGSASGQIAQFHRGKKISC